VDLEKIDVPGFFALGRKRFNLFKENRRVGNILAETKRVWVVSRDMTSPIDGTGLWMDESARF